MVELTSEVTGLLDAWSGGDRQALERLLPLVVDDLRRLARSHLAREAPGHTLEPTALVNELYLRLEGRREVHWENRTQFFAGVATMMRRILVDHARHRRTAKQGGGARPVSFDEVLGVPQLVENANPDLMALDEALGTLAQVDPRQSRIVELRYFVGLTIEETARALDISPMTVKREWRTARLYLLRALSPA